MQFKYYSEILIKYFHVIFLEKKLHTIENNGKRYKSKRLKLNQRPNPQLHEASETNISGNSGLLAAKFTLYTIVP